MSLEPRTDEERLHLRVEELLDRYKTAAIQYNEYACTESYNDLKLLEDPIRLALIRALS